MISQYTPYILATVLVLCVIFLIYRSARERMQFRAGRNPYSRICKQCGAHQDFYLPYWGAPENLGWWSEMYPIGNNPQCRCHGHASPERS